MTTSEVKVCESCGERFGCGAKSNGCWCADATLSPQIAEDLKAKYRDCLCPTCLNSLAVQASIVVTYPDGSAEIVHGAVRVETDNFHQGMFDFYDASGTLLKQISMNANIDWEIIGPK